MIMNMKADEINAMALAIAKVLAQNKSKKEIANIKLMLQQIICNLCTYLID